jgi:tRNA U34 5-methylaminomethyl-2-thiouridine-forming methyltransferase MnmC
MTREMILTADGSHSVMVSGTNMTYHSRYGAIQESRHVYIDSGLTELLHTRPVINIFEMGFGTGLNALLAMMVSASSGQRIYYETIDAFPLENIFFEKLNYCERLEQLDLEEYFQQLHLAEWEKAIAITPLFDFKKARIAFQEYSFDKTFDLVFYDAFAPAAQPGLWTREIFAKIFYALAPEGMILTHCSKGEVRRAMEAAGFRVHKLRGPAHKREILKAVKI